MQSEPNPGSRNSAGSGRPAPGTVIRRREAGAPRKPGENETLYKWATALEILGSGPARPRPPQAGLEIQHTWEVFFHS